MFLTKLAFKNLSRHKRRTILTAIVLALAIMVYLVSDSLLVGLRDMSFENIIELETGHLQVVNSKYWDEKEELPLENLITYDQSLKEDIRHTSGFEALSPQLNFSATLNNGIDELPVMGKGVIPADEKDVFSIDEQFVEGEFFKPGEYKAVIGAKLAQLMDLVLGDYITLLTRTKEGTFNTIDAEISGLVHTANPMFNEGVVYVPLDIAQQALNLDGKVSQIPIRLEGREKTKEAVADLNGRLGKDDRGNKANLHAYSWRQSAEVVIAMSDAQNVENQMVLGIILIIAAVGIVNTVILSALERMEETGMMKALGLKEWEIVYVFALEAAGIGLLGGLMGCLAGGIGVGLLHTYGFDIFALGGAMSENLGSSFGIPVIDKIYGGVNPGAFIFVFSFGVIVSFLVSLLPARWASRKDPVKAIYHR